MYHSHHVGFRLPSMAFSPCDCSPERRVAVRVGSKASWRTTVSLSGLAFFLAYVASETLPERQSRAVSVGKSSSPVRHNPEAITNVGCVKGGSRQAMPFDIVPERGQVPENAAKVRSPVDAKEV